MKKFNKCLNNLKKILRDNLISILIIIILVILIIYFNRHKKIILLMKILQILKSKIHHRITLLVILKMKTQIL